MYKIYKKEGILFIEITTKKLVVTLCDFAASIYSIYFNDELMTQTLKDEKDFLIIDVYHGKTIGRSANRIKGNKINISGQEFFISNNEGGNTLHGGLDGLSTKFFNFKVLENNNETKVIFSYLSKNGESGFPGNLNVTVTYIVSNDDITCMFETISDMDTICNLTNHSYFNLGENNLTNLSFKIDASNYLLATVDELLPIRKENVFKELNFHEFKKIMDDINSPNIKIGKANGYDHNFYLDSHDTSSPHIFLKSNKYLLSITTDFECCQIYSDNYVIPYNWIGLDSSKTRRALAIEPQDDFINRKILKANEKYQRFITYKFDILNS